MNQLSFICLCLFVSSVVQISETACVAASPLQKSTPAIAEPPELGLVSVEEDDKIVGGQQAQLGQFPYSATLTTNRYFCGGSIIDQSWVLTAAHCCVSGAGDYTVTGGVYNLHQQSGNEVKKGVVAVYPHPGYDDTTGENDLGLLQLATPFTFTQFIQPISLPPPNLETDGKQLTVAGWGLTSEHAPGQPDIIRWVTLTGIPNNQCQLKAMPTTDKNNNNSTTEKDMEIFDSQICAGGNGKSSCYGDSGSALTTLVNNALVQVGVVSGGRRCGSAGVYTRIPCPSYLAWIQQVTGLQF